MEWNRKTVRTLLGLIAFGVALFVGLWHWGEVRGWFQAALGMASFFVIGLCAAFILNAPLRLIETKLFSPLNRRLGTRWARIRRPLSLLLTVVLVLGIVVLVVFMVIPEMVNTVKLLGEEIPKFVDTANEWLGEMRLQYGDAFASSIDLDFDWAKVSESVIDWLRNGAGSFFVGTFSAASSIVSSVFSFVVGMIVAVYVLASKERLSRQVRRVLYAYLPEAKVDRLRYVGGEASRIFGGFLGGQFTEGVILGLLFFLGMMIFGFPFAPMISVLVGLTSLIPVFGAFIAAVIGAFMILVNQGFARAGWFIVFFLVVQQIEGNLIYPHVVGKSVMLPGLWVLVAATLGGNIAGILGMLITIPLASLSYLLLREAVDRRNAARAIAAEKLD